jgi:hypothetical protein
MAKKDFTDDAPERWVVEHQTKVKHDILRFYLEQWLSVFTRSATPQAPVSEIAKNTSSIAKIGLRFMNEITV